MKNIHKCNRSLSESIYIRNIFNSVTSLGMILDEYSRIVLTNDALLNTLGLSDEKSILGLKPGEVFSCIHYKEDKNGCGASMNCNFCDVNGILLESVDQDCQISEEAKLTILQNNTKVSLDLQVTATPLKKDDQNFTIVIFEDIADKKRKEVLEKIFFHDILNVASNIKNISNLLLDTVDMDIISEMIPLLNFSSKKLIQQITYQKLIRNAENGDLTLNHEEVNPAVIIREIIKQYKATELYRDYEFEENIDDEQTTIFTDETILYRILDNLILNALEASGLDKKISLGLSIVNNKIIFYFQNSSVMSSELKSKVFKRSFSTKGEDRGLGTYSVRLLVEKYLNGRVWFESLEEKGTTFSIELAISGKESI